MSNCETQGVPSETASAKLPDPSVLMRLGEHFAAGYFEEPEASPMRRLSRAVRRRFEHRAPMPYDGGPLYPCGVCRVPDEDRILSPSYSFTWSFDERACEERMAAGSAEERETLAALRDAMRAERDRLFVLRTPHTVGGAGYTHSIPHYGRVLREGLNEHARRIARGLRATAGLPSRVPDSARSDEPTVAHREDFFLGLQDVLAGIRAWHARLVEHLAAYPAEDEQERENRDRILEAFQRVPFEPARTFFEAVLAYNFVYYLDDCDNPGRVDQELLPYYNLSPERRDGSDGRARLPPSRLERAEEAAQQELRPPKTPGSSGGQRAEDAAQRELRPPKTPDSSGAQRAEDEAQQELRPPKTPDSTGGLRDEALALLERFADNVYRNWGWSESIGGSRPDGGPAYNELTVLCIEAARGKARPSLQLRIRRDMPDEVWDAALDSLASGNGLPALYNEEGYLSALRAAGLGIAEEDLAWWNGGGCTETMIHGRSNVGSLDAGMNLPLAFVESLDRHLAGAPSFEALVDAVKRDFSAVIADIARLVSLDQETKALWRPQPMRSLLIDDCIDRGMEFNAGGARYNWSVINVAGLANVADSLAAIREVVFDKQEKTGAELLDILHRNFVGRLSETDSVAVSERRPTSENQSAAERRATVERRATTDEAFRLRLARCPRFGNDDPRVDQIAADIAEHVFREFLGHRPWRGGKFLPSCIMFVTFADAGARVGATPDGRRAGEPVADSIGPVQGRDRSGPTALLRSVARLPLGLAAGTPILNARFSKKLFRSAEGRECLRGLIRTFFGLGGLQIQINVVDQAVLLDAIEHPERHADLIIRVGGYSAHFNDLPLDVKRSILERTEHWEEGKIG